MINVFDQATQKTYRFPDDASEAEISAFFGQPAGADPGLGTRDSRPNLAQRAFNAVPSLLPEPTADTPEQETRYYRAQLRRAFPDLPMTDAGTFAPEIEQTIATFHRPAGRLQAFAEQAVPYVVPHPLAAVQKGVQAARVRRGQADVAALAQRAEGAHTGPAPGIGPYSQVEPRYLDDPAVSAWVARNQQVDPATPLLSAEERAAQQAADAAFRERQLSGLAQEDTAVQAQQQALWTAQDNAEKAAALRSALYGDIAEGLTPTPGGGGAEGIDLTGQALTELQTSRPRTLTQTLTAAQEKRAALRQGQQAAAWQRLAPVERAMPEPLPGLETQVPSPESRVLSPDLGPGTQDPRLAESPGELIARVTGQRQAQAMPEGTPGELIAKARAQQEAGLGIGETTARIAQRTTQESDPLRRQAGELLATLLKDETGELNLSLMFQDLGASVAAGREQALRLYRRLGGLSHVLTLPKRYIAPLVDAQSQGRGLGGVWEQALERAAAGMTYAERRYFIKHGAAIMRGHEAAPELPGIQRYLHEWEQIKPDVLRRADEYGLEHGVLDNYFPQRTTQAAREALIEESGPLYEAIRKAVGPQGITDDAFTYEGFLDDIYTRRFGHVERSRRLTLPDRVEVNGRLVDVLENNPFEVLPLYVKGAGMRLGSAKVLGPDSGAAVAQLFKEAAHEVGTRRANAIKEIWDTLQGVPFDDPIATIVHRLQPFTDLLRAPLLTTSSMINAFAGLVPQATRFGIANTLNSTLKVLAHTFTGGRVNPGQVGEALERGLQVGAWAQEGVLQHLTYGFEPLRAGAGTLRKALRTAAELPTRVTGLTWVNRQINKIAVVGARDVMQTALTKAQAGDGQMLLDMADYFHFGQDDVARWLREGLSQTDVDRTMQLSSARFNLHDEFAVDVPRFFRHPVAREFLAFTGVLRALGTLSYQVVSQARHNPKALAVFFGGAALTARAEQVIKNKLKGKNERGESTVEVWADALMRGGVLGLWGKYADIAQYAAADKRNAPFEAGTRQLAPPVIRQLDQIWQALHLGKEEPLRRAIPIYDIIAVQLLGRRPLSQNRKSTGAVLR